MPNTEKLEQLMILVQEMDKRIDKRLSHIEKSVKGLEANMEKVSGYFFLPCSLTCFSSSVSM